MLNLKVSKCLYANICFFGVKKMHDITNRLASGLTLNIGVKKKIYLNQAFKK